MKRSLSVITAVALLGLSAGASADEATGRIQAMDVQTRTILLDDGQAYVLSEDVAIESLQPGTEIKVSYEEEGGQKVVKEVTAGN